MILQQELTKNQQKTCNRQNHPNDQIIQYICLQQQCMGKYKLACKKCFKKYHFGHRFFPLRQNLNLMKTQEEASHSSRIKEKYQKTFDTLEMLEIQINQSILQKTRKIFEQLKSQIGRIGDRLFQDRIISKTIYLLKYKHDKQLSDLDIEEMACFLANMSQIQHSQKAQKQIMIIEQINQKVKLLSGNMENIINSISQRLKQLISFSETKKINEQQIYKQQHHQKQKQINNKLNLQKDQISLKKERLKQKVKEKHFMNKKSYYQKDQNKNQNRNFNKNQNQIKATYSERQIISRDQNKKKLVKMQAISSQSESQKQDEVYIKRQPKVKKQYIHIQQQNAGSQQLKNCIEIDLDNPLKNQIQDYFAVLNISKDQNHNLKVKSINLNFDGVQGFIPNQMLQNIPPILENLKIIKINLYQTVKIQFIQKIVKNFQNLQELSITECEKYTDELIDQIVRKNPKLKRFYTFFNLRQNFDKFVESRQFKKSPYTSKLSIKQCLKLSQLQFLQNIHIDECHKQQTIGIIDKMTYLKEIVLGTYLASRYIKKSILKSIEKKQYLQAISFINLILVYDQCDSRQIFNWVKKSKGNMNTFYFHNFDRLTDKHVYILSQQCEVKNIYLQNIPGVKGKSIGMLTHINSLAIKSNHLKTKEFLQSGFQELTEIRVLLLPFNCQITQKNKFSSLKCLFWENLSRPRQVLYDQKFFENLPHLQTLSLRRYIITTKQMKNILTFCPKISKIELYLLDIDKSNQKTSEFINENRYNLYLEENKQKLALFQKEDFCLLSNFMQKITHIFYEYDGSNFYNNGTYIELDSVLNEQIILNLRKIQFLKISKLPSNQKVLNTLAQKGVFLQIKDSKQNALRSLYLKDQYLTIEQDYENSCQDK